MIRIVVARRGRAPQGAASVFPRKALDDIKGFRDVHTPNTDVEIRLDREEYRSVAASVEVYHILHVSIANSIGGQTNRGRGRYVLGMSLLKTAEHTLFRFIPFAVGGWIMAGVKNKGKERGD